MDEPRWEEPPPLGAGTSYSGRWIEILMPLMQEPKRWARIATYDKQQSASSGVGNLKNKTVKRPPGQWEFVSRRVEDGKYGLFARYLGEDGEV